MKVLLHQSYHRRGGLDGLFRIALQNGCDGVEVHRLVRTYEPSEEIYYNKLVDFKAASGQGDRLQYRSGETVAW